MIRNAFQCVVRKDADQTLRQQIAEDRQHALQDDTGAVALAPQYLYTQRVIHQIRVRN